MTVVALPTRAVSPSALVWQRFLRHRLALASLAFLGILLVLSLAAPLIAASNGFSPCSM